MKPKTVPVKTSVNVCLFKTSRDHAKTGVKTKSAMPPVKFKGMTKKERKI